MQIPFPSPERPQPEYLFPLANLGFGVRRKGGGIDIGRATLAPGMDVSACKYEFVGGEGWKSILGVPRSPPAEE